VVKYSLQVQLCQRNIIATNAPFTPQVAYLHSHAPEFIELENSIQLTV